LDFVELLQQLVRDRDNNRFLVRARRAYWHLLGAGDVTAKRATKGSSDTTDAGQRGMRA
jgi:hypothetical protein